MVSEIHKRISIDKIKYFRSEILKWYYINGRKFPWRLSNRSDYDYIIAEVLLQRTKAETISIYYSRFLNVFPNWKSISSSTLVKLEKYLKPIGLYKQRSKRLLCLAQNMIDRGEIIPMERKELESLPMMGQYIANSVELIILNRNVPLIDVNMARVINRYFGAKTKADLRYDEKLQKLAFQIVNHKKSKKINWGILDFAALVCKSINPLCSDCPLKKSCKYFRYFQKSM